MTPEAADYLQHNKISLQEAKTALAANIYRMAAREAYIAALNAARAIVFEKKTIASKSHSGTRSLVHELVRDGLKIDRDVLDILSKGFKLKTIADYGPHEDVGEATATDFVGRAERFVEQIESELQAS